MQAALQHGHGDDGRVFMLERGTRPHGMDTETSEGSSYWTEEARPNCMTMGSTKGSSCWPGDARSHWVVMESMEGSSCWVTSSPWQVTPAATWV